MKVVTQPETSIAVISPDRRFDFNTHRDFRASYEQVIALRDIRTIKVDLGSVEYLDSSALGMLLLLKDKAEAAGQQVEITNAAGEVKQILEVANFAKLFRIN